MLIRTSCKRRARNPTYVRSPAPLGLDTAQTCGLDIPSRALQARRRTKTHGKLHSGVLSSKPPFPVHDAACHGYHRGDAHAKSHDEDRRLRGVTG